MKVTVWFADNFRYYVVFSVSILFILGLIFSYKLAEKVFFDILITHLTDEWKNQDLRKAVIVVNLKEGTCAVAVLFFAFVADSYLGLFKVVVCSTTVCTIGLFLTYYAARSDDQPLDLGVFYPALVLMTLSQAAEMITLPAFLGDQVVARDQPATQEEEERAQSRANFWWYFVSFLAAIFALFGPLRNVKFRDLALVLAIAMGAAFLWFLLGLKTYRCIKPTDSPLSDVVRVIYSAIVKRNVAYPEFPQQLYKNSSGLVQILPHVSWLRWLDRAAVMQERPAGLNCSVERVKGVKFLLKMVPMWTTFLTFSLVAASGSTFFLQEATSITDNTFPIQFFVNLQRFTGFMVSEISYYVFEKLGKTYNNARRMMLVRIGIGMICCVLCCIAAWANAVHRLRLVGIYGDAEDLMSVYRLTPQYFLLGVMAGLSAEGLGNFFNSQASRSISKYGQSFGECVMGVGKFLSVVCILILSTWLKWFKDELNPSRLDKYYMMLAILSSLNFILYCLVARWYGDDTFLSKDQFDVEMGYAGQADPRIEDCLELLASGQNVTGQERSRSGYNPTENTNSEQSQTHEDSSRRLLQPETGQEITSSSSTLFPADNRRDDHEAEALQADVFESMDQVSPLVSESTMDGPSDAPLLRGTRSFPRPSSRAVYKRIQTMR